MILLNPKFEECGWWGPRPRELQKWVMEKGLALPKEERYREVRSFYARDKGLSTMGEIVEMLEECCARGPVRAAGGS